MKTIKTIKTKSIKFSKKSNRALAYKLNKQMAYINSVIKETNRNYLY